MPVRMYPSDLGYEEQPKQLIEPSIIPSWVPVLLAIALIGAFALGFYAISQNKKEVYREHGTKSDA